MYVIRKFRWYVIRSYFTIDQFTPYLMVSILYGVTRFVIIDSKGFTYYLSVSYGAEISRLEIKRIDAPCAPTSEHTRRIDRT